MDEILKDIRTTINCLLECVSTFLGELGGWAIAVLVTCLLGGAILTLIALLGTAGVGVAAIAAVLGPILLKCLGIAIAGGVLLGIANCLLSC